MNQRTAFRRGLGARERRRGVPVAQTLCDDVLRGLALPQPALPPKYFYDERGAKLFERICELPEYYPTRTEIGILREHGQQMADGIGAHARIIEFGSGSGIKTRILLEHLDDPAAYVPIDIATRQLRDFANDLRTAFPGLNVMPVAGDYTARIHLPPPPAGTARTATFFPGSTIGNFEERDALAFLRQVRALCGEGGALLIGADMHKDPEILEAAYNDSEGVTAEFNLNLLHRINRECHADFPLDAFLHRAVYDEARMRIEMRLECVRGCTVHVPDPRTEDVTSFEFSEGDHILTEYSHKYTPDSFRAMAEQTGWTVAQRWTDERGWFGVWLLE